MSDSYIILTTKKKVDNPQELIEKTLKWLKSNNYIEEKLSNCVLNSKDKGYRPSENHIKAIGGDENILRLIVCGVETKAKREVFNASSFTAMTKLECPICSRNRFEGITPQDFFMDNCTKEQMDLFNSVFPVFNQWINNEKATLTCPHCSLESKIEDYELDNSLSFSNFGLTFWNWPDLTNEFLDDIREVIGKEVIRINGSI